MEKKKVCIALGFFDSVHLGHRKILNATKTLAQKYKAEPCAMTFSNNIYGIVKQKGKLIYLYEERCGIFQSLGITPISFEFTPSFKNIEGEKFLEIFTNRYDVKAFICGKDFAFGKNKAFGVEYLQAFTKSHFIDILIENEVCLNGTRISTSFIKSLLQNGKKIAEANFALGENYFLSGIVENGEGRGNNLGFPTANIRISQDKFLIGSGVYATDTVIDGQTYKSITNVGTKPTFGDDKISIETNILDFNENLYGKEIKVIFNQFMRDIICFKSTQELINQLKEDKKNRCLE